MCSSRLTRTGAWSASALSRGQELDDKLSWLYLTEAKLAKRLRRSMDEFRAFEVDWAALPEGHR